MLQSDTVDYKLYRNYIKELRVYARVNGLTDNDVNIIFENYFDKLTKNGPCRTFKKILFKLIQFISVIIFTFIISALVLYNHPHTHNLFLRNMQHFIYPGLNVLRKIAVPIVTRYPSLTEYYDEWCLVDNPYFQVTEMDCWPCSNVQTVPDITEWSLTKNFNTGQPFTRAENSTDVDLSKIIDTLNDKNHRNIFVEDAGRISSNNPSYKTIKDVMDRKLEKNSSPLMDTHILWRINRMKPSRILRKLFPKSPTVPDSWGQSTERFLFIDEPKSQAYDLPHPECANVILKCTSGMRLIKINPSLECRQNCRTLSIVLSAGQTLWYNWWYWRPVSYPVMNSTEISINYLTSYC